MYFCCLLLFVVGCQQDMKKNEIEKADLKFTNMTEQAGVFTRESLGGHGAIAGDVNGDGLVDLFYTNTVSHGQENLFINQGNGTFTEESVQRGADDPQGGSHGMVLVDIDCDGDFDIWNGGTGSPNHLYSNDGKGFYTDITKEAGILEQWAATRGVTAGDVNGDGQSDLLAVNPSWTNEIYINKNGTNFFALENNGNINLEPDLGLKNTTALLDGGIPEERDHSGLKQGVTLVDFDHDGDMDLISCIWEYPLHVIKNDNNTSFQLEDDKKIFGVKPNDYSGSTFCDLNNDGFLECVLAGDSVTAVFENLGKGKFRDVTIEANILGRGYHVAAGDVDNDGLIDLYVTRSYQTNLLYRNLGDFHFELVENAGACLDSVVAQKSDCRSACFVDYDADGDLDVWVAYKRNKGQLFRNELGSENNWIKIQLIGTAGDAGAFGAQVWIYRAGYIEESRQLIGYQQAQAAYGYMGQNDPILHFGIGSEQQVDIKVRFLNSTEIIKLGIVAKQLVVVSGLEAKR